jgi:hypothetical protein
LPKLSQEIAIDRTPKGGLLSIVVHRAIRGKPNGVVASTLVEECRLKSAGKNDPDPVPKVTGIGHLVN